MSTGLSKTTVGSNGSGSGSRHRRRRSSLHMESPFESDTTTENSNHIDQQGEVLKRLCEYEEHSHPRRSSAKKESNRSKSQNRGRRKSRVSDTSAATCKQGSIKDVQRTGRSKSRGKSRDKKPGKSLSKSRNKLDYKGNMNKSRSGGKSCQRRTGRSKSRSRSSSLEGLEHTHSTKKRSCSLDSIRDHRRKEDRVADRASATPNDDLFLASRTRSRRGSRRTSLAKGEEADLFTREEQKTEKERQRRSSLTITAHSSQYRRSKSVDTSSNLRRLQREEDTQDNTIHAALEYKSKREEMMALTRTLKRPASRTAVSSAYNVILEEKLVQQASAATRLQTPLVMSFVTPPAEKKPSKRQPRRALSDSRRSNLTKAIDQIVLLSAGKGSTVNRVKRGRPPVSGSMNLGQSLRIQRRAEADAATTTVNHRLNTALSLQKQTKARTFRKSKSMPTEASAAPSHGEDDMNKDACTIGESSSKTNNTEMTASETTVSVSSSASSSVLSTQAKRAMNLSREYRSSHQRLQKEVTERQSVHQQYSQSISLLNIETQTS